MNRHRLTLQGFTVRESPKTYVSRVLSTVGIPFSRSSRAPRRCWPSSLPFPAARSAASARLFGNRAHRSSGAPRGKLESWQVSRVSTFGAEAEKLRFLC